MPCLLFITAAVPKLTFTFTKKLTQFDNAKALSNQYLQFPFYKKGCFSATAPASLAGPLNRL